jgi:iron complex outermembrane receptor protein
MPHLRRKLLFLVLLLGALRMSKSNYLGITSRLALTAMIAALPVPAGVQAQEVVDDDIPVMEALEAETSDQVKEMTVISERDKAGLLEQQPSDLLFGMKKPLLETPRSATFVSDETLDTYGVTTVDDLAAVSPGTIAVHSASSPRAPVYGPCSVRPCAS